MIYTLKKIVPQDRYLYLISIIFCLGLVLRVFDLGNFPKSIHRDEALLGYNAYSILKTGKDMSGYFLPLHLKSFIFSPAGYSYLSIPFIVLFGLNEFSTRLASAFFGSLSIIALFFIVILLFKERKDRFLIGSVSSFLLAISPWHINLSRTATENVPVTFFILLGMLFYLLFTSQKKTYFLVLSFLSFSFTLLLYQAPRAFLPLFIPVMILIFSQRKFSALLLKTYAIFTLFILLPLLIIFMSKDLSLRVRTVSIFSTDKTQLILDEQIRGEGAGANRFITRVFHNKPHAYLDQFTQNYFKHFSFDFLFTDQGFPDRYRVPLVGLMYIFEIPFILCGFFLLFRDEETIGWFLLSWIGLAVIGSALTFDDIPNLQRTLIMLPAYSIVSGFGIVEVLKKLKSRRLLRNGFIAGFSLLIIYSVSFYLHQYYVQMSIYRPWYRHDGYKELVSQVNNLSPNYTKVVITNRESAPTIFFLFYNRYNPSTFQKETIHPSVLDFDRVNFGKLVFSLEECPTKLAWKNKTKRNILEKGNILFVDSGLCKVSASPPVKVIRTVRRADGSIAFRLTTLPLSD